MHKKTLQAHSHKGRKRHKPKGLKLIPPRTLWQRIGGMKEKIGHEENDNGKVIFSKEVQFNNGILYIGRVYIYHPTKGWRSRSHREFKPFKFFQGLKSGASV